MARELLEPEPGLPRHLTPEQRLWTAVLALLLHDARVGRGDLLRATYSVKQAEAAAALNDVERCGPMLRWCAGMAGLDAEWVCGKFNSMAHGRAA